MNREEFSINGCLVKTYEKDDSPNSPVTVNIEHGSPAALVVLCGFIHFLGEPLSIHYKHDVVWFEFPRREGNPIYSDVIKKWQETLPVLE